MDYGLFSSIWFFVIMFLLFDCFQGNHTTASVNNKQVFSGDVKMTSKEGFVALGTDNFGLANFDNFSVS